VEKESPLLINLDNCIAIADDGISSQTVVTAARSKYLTFIWLSTHSVLSKSK
jgi:hypothetical protein